MFWRRSHAADDADEQRILVFIAEGLVFCETAISLANKLGVNPRLARTVLERLVRRGAVRQHVFGDIETVYYRNPNIDEREAANE